MLQLQTIADHIGAEVIGDGHYQISSLKPIHQAKAGDLSFLSHSKYQKHLSTTQASAVILTKEFVNACPCHALVVDDPYVAYAKAAQLFISNKTYAQGIHSSVVVGEDCQIDASATLLANVVIGNRVNIGAKGIIHPGVVIGDDCQIGEHVTLHANVTIYDGVTIGDNVTIHSGAVLGSDGFGLAKSDGQWLKIPQLGRVIVGNDVEIGANTTIDRGALGNTVIGEGVKLDNQIQIGHNVTIGAHTAMAACSGVSGSVTIGKHCMISGMVGFTGHFNVTDHVVVTGQTMVTKGIEKPGVYSSGTVFEPHDKWKRNAARFRQLDTLAKRIKELESKLEKLT